MGLTQSQETPPPQCEKKLTFTERDVETVMERWREQQGSLANAELEDGQVDSGYNRNVVRGVSFIYMAGDRTYASPEDEHLPLHMMCTLSLQYRRLSRGWVPAGPFRIVGRLCTALE